MTPARRRRPVRAFGDSAVVIDVDTVDEAHELAVAIDTGDRPGIEDVIVGFRSVTVVADPMVTDVIALGHALSALSTAGADRPPATLVEIPVALDGSDLDEVAQLARMTPSRVVDLLTGTDLQVAFVGFAPGFAYLVGLPPDLASVPRRRTPRPAVPGGSVALAGGFAGIYPRTSPGGWQVVGRTVMALFDPETPPYSALRSGDLVRLRIADVPRLPDGRPTKDRPPLRSGAGRTIVVDNPGLLSMVQDGGRLGVAGLGVPRAGAADPYALRIANRLVGNDEHAAGIETTARGPTLRFSAPAHVAVVGTADVRVDGRTVPGHSIVPVDAGQTVTVGDERHGLRSYIAVGGGIEIPTVLGSRSSDVLSGLGAGPLVRGDVLGLGAARRPRGRVRAASPAETSPTIRVVAGPHVVPSATVDALVATTWAVDPSSDRIGVRLRGGRPLEPPAPGTASQGMITGAIQLPPDGRPIVLLCDHATVGGYPVIATVVSADLGTLGQLRAASTVRFELVDLPDARRARARREAMIDEAVVGWYPVRSD
jgi:KipI family sensor histidine kinase inhibitor